MHFVLGDHSLHFAFAEVAGGLVFIDLRGQQLQNGLAAFHFIFDVAELVVDLDEALPVLVDELDDLLAGALLDPLHSSQLSLQQDEIYLGTLSVCLLAAVSSFAQVE
jgi:hypothetical protein